MSLKNRVVFIDEATFSGAVIALREKRRLKRWTDWGSDSIVLATYLLVTGKAQLTPGPEGALEPVGHLTPLLRKFALAKEVRVPDVADRAAKNTTRWVRKNTQKLREHFGELKELPDYSSWLEGEKNICWRDNLITRYALFDRAFVPYIAEIIGCTQKELEAIFTQSRDDRKLRAWIRAKTMSEDVLIAEDAFVLSALMRGRYHRGMAVGMNYTMAAHPFRKQMVRGGKAKRKRLRATNAMECLVNIIIGSAMKELSHDRTVQTWVDNMEKAAKLLSPNLRVDLSEASEYEAAESKAAKAAKKMNLPVNNAAIDWCLRNGPGWALGAVTGLLLLKAPWTAAPAVVGTRLVHGREMRAAGKGSREGTTKFATEPRLQRLIDPQLHGSLERVYTENVQDFRLLE